MDILSQSNKSYGRVEKYKVFEEFKIEEYWVIDSDKEPIEVYSLKDNSYSVCGIFTSNRKIISQVSEGIKLVICYAFTDIIFF